MRESCSPLAAAVVAAPMRKLCPAYWEQSNPAAASADLTAATNRSLIRCLPSVNLKKAPPVGLTDKEKYWKFVVNNTEALAVHNLKDFGEKHVVQYTKLKGSTNLLESPALLSFLSSHDAKTCLFDFACLVQQALVALHEKEWAHWT